MTRVYPCCYVDNLLDNIDDGMTRSLLENPESGVPVPSLIGGVDHRFLDLVQ
jgi:hypothetical protein